MSKFVKGLLVSHVQKQLAGAADALLVSMVGVDANSNGAIRAELAEKGVRILFVRNSMARRACMGTRLEGLFDEIHGPVAVCWGSTDIVSLAKEIVRLATDKRFAPDRKALPGTGFLIVGGIMDGERMSAETVRAVSKWASREETISIVIGQAVGAGANLIAQFLGAGGTLAGQISSKGEECGEDSEAPAAATAG
ncbi:MAG: 50S ribosomal protein L10 [Planctomycetia bacterium]|nr:50S ribosomal protein L10 [Planctomycetia bacterium]